MSTPFRQLTQRQFNQLAAVPFQAGTLQTFRLPETGLGARLYLNFKGQMTVNLGTGTAALSALGIRNLLSRITVKLNDGTILYEMHGFNSKIPSILDYGYDAEYTLIARGYTGSTPFNAPAANTILASQNYDTNFTIEIPFINNDKDMLGLVLLQNGTTQATVELQFNPLIGSDAISSLVKTTGNATVTYNPTITPVLEFYSLPNVPQKDLMTVLKPYLGWMSQWKSEYEAITSPAQFNKKLDRGSVYTHIGHYLIQNFSPSSTPFTSFNITMKGSEVPLTIPADIQLFLQRRNYGLDLPDGVIIHDFDRSFSIPQFGDERDYIDSRALTELKSVINFDQSQSFNAGSYLYTITHKLTPIAL